MTLAVVLGTPPARGVLSGGALNRLCSMRSMAAMSSPAAWVANGQVSRPNVIALITITTRMKYWKLDLST